MVACCTRFNANQTWRQRCKERGDIIATQPSTDDDRAARVYAVHLKDVLGDIQTNRANILHGRLSLM